MADLLKDVPVSGATLDARRWLHRADVPAPGSPPGRPRACAMIGVLAASPTVPRQTQPRPFVPRNSATDD
ncbi:hypothetical protein CEE80_12655 [Lactobacillus crispatus]|nr:hypothetical protein CEE80_12655 [Lactobacillus crispatus]